MNELIFIGTLHAGLTPVVELEKMLDELRPDRLLVEMQQKDITAGTIASYPEEMMAALAWARRQGVLVYGFDCGISIIKEGKTEHDNQAVIERQKKIVSRHDWKDFNKEECGQLLDGKDEAELIDQDKWRAREKAMAKNIAQLLPEAGTTVVLTGVGHLSFFEKRFEGASFPYRR